MTRCTPQNPLTRRFAPPSPARGEGKVCPKLATNQPSPLAGEGGEAQPSRVRGFSLGQRVSENWNKLH